jgi:hypothetical protein
MAAMSTALTHFASQGDSITYTFTGHTAADPRLVLQKRRVPSGNRVMAENELTVVYGTQDSAGANIPQRISFSVRTAFPITGVAADMAAALVVLRDIVASDEFTNHYLSQNPIKAI